MPRIGSYVFSDKLIKLMNNKINKTYKIKKEIGFLLCKDYNNVLSESEECIGTRCEVHELAMTKCKNPRDKLAGVFHTHPLEQDISEGDLSITCALDFSCVGFRKKGINTISCYSRKANTNVRDCLKDAEKLQQDKKELDSLNDVLKNMRPKTIEEDNRYDELVDDYNDRRKQFFSNFDKNIKEYFDRIIIRNMNKKYHI